MSPVDTPTTVKKKGTIGGTLRGIVIVILLVVAAGAGGYFFGTMQKFAPVQNVPAGTAGATTSTAPGSAPGLTVSPPGATNAAAPGAAQPAPAKGL